MIVLEDGSLAAEESFTLFGQRSRFALELSLAKVQPVDAVPCDSIGSWGGWRLWVSDVNLSRMQFETDDGIVEVQEVRWFLAPLIRWLVRHWNPLLHETRLPQETGWGDRRPRWARLAYLAMLERSGDDIDRFRPWQDWGSRHALRFAAEGGVVPDVFFQRVGDEIELSWGDRIQPGGEATAFLVEDGVARAHVDDVGRALEQAINWLLGQGAINAADWSQEVAAAWRAIKAERFSLGRYHWYLDAQPGPGPLWAKFCTAMEAMGRELPQAEGLWLGSLSPEIAMFGDLTPLISQGAATTLLTEYYGARSNAPEQKSLTAISSEEPAWMATSPWENGYALALDMLEDVDPAPAAAFTNLAAILEALSVTVRQVALGREGPRGVALAGSGLRPTILVNKDHLMNQGRGHRFTEAHELCHILFDRHRARPLAHSSTPWASPSIEQRANAFAAMLLMPPYRAKRPVGTGLPSLSRGISILAGQLQVSRIALCRHLANLGEIDSDERDHILSATVRG